MPKEEYTQKNRPMAVSTPPPVPFDTLLLVSLSGHEGTSQLFCYQLEMVALNNKCVPFDKLLGGSITVRLNLPDGSPRFLNGICHRICQGNSDATFTAYSMEIVPTLWRLSKRMQSRIFQQASVKAILKEVLNGLNVDDSGLKGVYHPRDYCVQYRETDLNFACRLMEEEGIRYYFRHSDGNHELVLADLLACHAPVPGVSELTYQTAQNAPGLENRILSWIKQQELRAGQYTLRDHCFELTGGDPGPFQNLQAAGFISKSMRVGRVDHPLDVGDCKSLELYDWPGEYAQRFDGIGPGGDDRPKDLEKIFEDNKRTAVIRMQQESLGAVAIQGTSNCRQLAAGHKFQLVTKDQDNIAKLLRAEGEYILTTVGQFATQGDYRSGGGSLQYHNHFTCIPEAMPLRPPRITPKPFVQGTQTAVVVGLAKDDEISTDKYGRVKVRFHWDRRTEKNGSSSCWIRVGTPWAGANWGMIHIPRVGQEVIVDFLEGDPDQPIIVGSVYSAANMPPYPLPEHRTRSGVKSRSSLKGTPENFNEIRFEDKKGAEELHVQAERNLTTLVKANESRSVGGNSDTTIGGRSDTTIGGHCTVDTKGNVAIAVRGDVGMLTAVFAGDYRLGAVKKILMEADEGIALRCGGAVIGIDAAGNIYLEGTSIQQNDGAVPPDLLTPILPPGMIPIEEPSDPDAPPDAPPGPAPSPNPLPPPPPPKKS